MGLTLLLCSEAATGGVLQEKVFLEIQQNSKENTCARVSFLIKLQASACNFVKEETLAQVFSCEFCKISENSFFKGHLRATASLCSITKSSTVYYWTRKIVICYEKWYGELKSKLSILKSKVNIPFRYYLRFLKSNLAFHQPKMFFIDSIEMFLNSLLVQHELKKIIMLWSHAFRVP